jgi:hypothetical protein
LMGVPPNCAVTVLMDCDHATSVVDVSGTLDGGLVNGLKYQNFCGLKVHTTKVQLAAHNREVWQEEQARAVKARPRFQPMMEIDNPRKGRLPTRPAMSRSSPVAFCYSAAAHGQTAMEMQFSKVVDGQPQPRQHGILTWCFVQAFEELRYECTHTELLWAVRRRMAAIKEKELPRMDQEVLLTFSTPHSNPQTMKVMQCLQLMAGRGLSVGGGAYEGVTANGVPFSIVPPPPPGYIKGEGIGGGTGESPGGHRYPVNGEGTGGSPGYGMAHDRRDQHQDRSYEMHGRAYDPNGMGPDRPHESNGTGVDRIHEPYGHGSYEPYDMSHDRSREPPYGYAQPGDWPSMLHMEKNTSRDDAHRRRDDSPPPPPPPPPRPQQQQGSDNHPQQSRSDRASGNSAVRSPSADYSLQSAPNSGSLKVPAPAPAPVPSPTEAPGESGGSGLIPNFFNVSPAFFGPRPNSQQVPPGPPPAQAMRGYPPQQMVVPGAYQHQTRHHSNQLSFTMPPGVGMPTLPAHMGAGAIPATTAPSFQAVAPGRGYSFTGPIAPTPSRR